MLKKQELKHFFYNFNTFNLVENEEVEALKHLSLNKSNTNFSAREKQKEEIKNVGKNF